MIGNGKFLFEDNIKVQGNVTFLIGISFCVLHSCLSGDLYNTP